jgi:ribosome-associated heat shock protein Hsp15
MREGRDSSRPPHFSLTMMIGYAGRGEGSGSVKNVPQQRLDRWLWFARLMKSRTLAAELVGAGRVRVNRVRVSKPSHMLREGDTLTIAHRGEVRIVRVVSLGERRGPPQEARLLYRPVDIGEQADRAGGGGRRRPSF